MNSAPQRLLAILTLGLGLTLASAGFAQQAAPPAPATTAPPAATAPAQPATPPAAPQSPIVAPGATIGPVPPAPAPAASSPAAPPAPDGDASSAQTIDVTPRPVVLVRGAASWDDGYKAIMASIAKARAGVLKGNLKEAGRPLTSFVDTDDNGFKFEAMIPIEAAPAGAVDLGPDAKIGVTPGGKAIKFQHRGAYDDVDSTYEAITAYLDEKGYDAQNVFAEEYLNDPKGPDDTALALDIYVFIK